MSKLPPLLATWVMRVAWGLLPLSVGDVVARSLDDAAASTQWLANIGLWAGWLAVLVGLLVRRPWSLTLVRICGPLPLAIAVAGAFASQGAPVALVHAAVVLAVAALPELAGELVDGLSYGDERRLLLKPPFALYLGPLPLAWLAVVAGASAGPLLLAAQLWIIGVPALATGWPLAYWGWRSLHQLSRRWVVFVPNGFVIHDLLTAREPFLLRRQDVVSIGPAAADVDLDSPELVDVSANSLGIVLEARLDGHVEIVPRERGVSQVREAERVLFGPTRPGAVLAEARERRIPR